jgi:hypothetical protein
VTDVEQDKGWREEYRKKRYLEHAPEQRLQQRLFDLLDNICAFDERGFLIERPNIEPLKRVFTHVLEEASLRNLPLKIEWERGQHFNGKAYRNIKRAADLWNCWRLPRGSYLLKYGMEEHLRPMIDRGTFRVSPATSYDDPSLNPAIRDEEMEFVEEIYEATLSFPEGGDYSIPVQHWTKVPITKGQAILQAKGNYYIACFADAFEHRLFDDFGYNACLVIRDPARFIDQIKRCAATVLPEWTFTANRVIYRDPYHPLRNDRICFSKHFRYAYQQEFRLVWNPRTRIEKLEYVSLNLGSLSDYCNLLIL